MRKEKSPSGPHPQEKFYRMMISLIVADEEILYEAAMGDSLTAKPIMATGQSFKEETSTL